MTRKMFTLFFAFSLTLLIIGCGDYEDSDSALSEDDYALTEDGDDYANQPPDFDKDAEFANQPDAQLQKLIALYGDQLIVDHPEFQPKNQADDPADNPAFDEGEDFANLPAEVLEKLMDLYGDRFIINQPNRPKKEDVEDPPIEMATDDGSIENGQEYDDDFANLPDEELQKLIALYGDQLVIDHPAHVNKNELDNFLDEPEDDGLSKLEEMWLQNHPENIPAPHRKK